MRSLASAPSSIDRTFAALADPIRRGVVELLSDGERRAGELAEAFEMSPPAMSRHLKVLRATGLVEELGLAEDARVRVYRLRRQPLSELGAWIADVEAFWADQLAAFKAHAERSRPPSGARPRKKKERPS